MNWNRPNLKGDELNPRAPHTARSFLTSLRSTAPDQVSRGGRSMIIFVPLFLLSVHNVDLASGPFELAWFAIMVGMIEAVSRLRHGKLSLPSA